MTPPPSLNQLILQWDAETVVTITVHVEDSRGRRGESERRREELIAAQLWMAAQGIELSAAADE